MTIEISKTGNKIKLVIDGSDVAEYISQDDIKMKYNSDNDIIDFYIAEFSNSKEPMAFASDASDVTIGGVVITSQAVFDAQLEEVFISAGGSAITTPDVIMSPVYYCFPLVPLEIFYRNIHKNYDNYKGKTEINGANYVTTTKDGRKTSLVTGVYGNYESNEIKVKSDSFDSNLFSETFNIISPDLSVDTSAVILNIGDDITASGKFTNLFMDACPQPYSFIGIIDSGSTPTTLCEGRPGWTLDEFTTLHKNDTHHNPFMQPVDPYYYWGATEFWKKVKAGTGTTEEMAMYQTGVKNLFDLSTGYPVSPYTNLVVYDNALDLFKVWNGSAWVTIAENTLGFTFNLERYLYAWDQTVPTIAHILLGLNDWYDKTEAELESEWIAWKAKLDTIISSIRAAAPSCDIAIGCPPPPGCSGDGYPIIEKTRRAYRLLAKNIIAAYATGTYRVYVLDYHSVVDSEYAYSQESEIPFYAYSGDARVYADISYIPSTDGQNQMGNLYGGFLQLYRDF